MKALLSISAIFLFSISSVLTAETITNSPKFSPRQIKQLSSVYINNNLHIENPVMVDVDEDGDFDILKFNSKGNVEYYKNTGSLENPEFVLENSKFDNYEMNTLLPAGIPFPLFLADKDGDRDMDIFGIVRRNNESRLIYAENTMGLDHYTLITIILVLVIVLLLVAIL
ncbi:MAG: VCBS repeat-containing protein [Bacteroidetes bacterium]|nr:VCBS repeat-containing protein [Bacteroidota bacterium]